jgi:hypothetical protein
MRSRQLVKPGEKLVIIHDPLSPNRIPMKYYPVFSLSLSPGISELQLGFHLSKAKYRADPLGLESLSSLHTRTKFPVCFHPGTTRSGDLG